MVEILELRAVQFSKKGVYHLINQDNNKPYCILMKNKNLNLVIHEDCRSPESDDVCKICVDAHRIDLEKKEYERDYLKFTILFN